MLYLHQILIINIILIIVIYYIIQIQFINNLTYGTIFKSVETKFNNFEFIFIDIPFSKIVKFCPPPPSNNSSVTYNELLLLDKITSKTNHKFNHIMDKLDQNAGHFFHKFIEKKNLKIHEKQFVLLDIFVSELEQITYKLKYVFNRPRAYQLGSYHNIPIKARYAITGNTPAYPSGHAMIGYGYCLFLSHLFPKYKKKFYKLAKQVDYSRINVGVHYPSDGIASKIVVHKIFKKIKYKIFSLNLDT